MKEKRIVKSLTAEQINMLRGNPNVISITDYRIKWSIKFLNEFCAAFENGVQVPQFLRDHGIDPDILGEGRIATFRNYYCHRWRPIENPAQLNTEKIETRKSSTKITRLEHDVAYLTQEVDFLKKIFIAENKNIAMTRRQRKNAQ